MRLGRKTLLIIAIGIFIIIIASLGMVAFQSFTEYNQLKEELAQIQQRSQLINIEKLSSKKEDLERKLNQTELQLESSKGVLSEPVGSVDGTDGIFKIAEAYGLLVIEITSPGSDTEDVEGANLQVVSLSAEVNGNVNDLLKFTTDLNKYFSTGAIKTVTISVPEGNTNNATANVQLALYTYRGD